jgi:Zn-dependent M28 family amino/carboxypeptidase
LKRASLAAAFVAAAILAMPVTVSAQQDDLDASSFKRDVRVDRVLAHERALQSIAEANGGIRASATPGFTASADYVTRRLQKAGYAVTRQQFTFPFFEEESPPVLTRTAPPPEKTYAPDTDVTTMQYSGSGDVTAALQEAGGNVVPPTAEPSSAAGCTAADYTGFTAGNVALIQRGTCTFEEKAAAAQAAGASAVIIFNEGQPGRTDAQGGTLGRPFTLPVEFVSSAVGVELVDAIRAGGGPVTVHVATSTVNEERTTENVLADTRKGDPDKTIVVGSHLDSVLEGPGINDNGSGTSMDLAIAEALAKRGPKLKNRVRFAFWGAEEEGLLGSTHYVETLPADKLAQIKANLNFDMIASPNFVRFVYDGDNSTGEGEVGPNGSGFIEKVFVDYFTGKGLQSEPTAFDGRSDYGPFIAAGIPAGGLFSGAEEIKTPEQAAIYGGTPGEAYDKCYHQACDTFANLNTTAIEQFSGAAAYAVLALGRLKGDIVDGAQLTPAAADGRRRGMRGRAKARPFRGSARQR